MEDSYYPTLGELLGLPVFQGGRLLAGESGLGSPVAGVNLTDTPDFERWVSARELLVSNCFAIRDDPQAVERFIPALAEKGLAGACVKPSRFLGTIPPAMLAAAKERDFPLIELPPEVRFADITRAVSDELLRRQTALLRSSLSVNQLLVQTIAAGAPLEQLAQVVREVTGMSALLVDGVNHRQAYSLTRRDGERFAALAEKELPRALIQGAEVHELSIDGRSAGALYLRPAGDGPAVDRDLLSQLLRTLPLEISRERSVREAESRGFTEFFLHLLSDHITDFRREQDRANAFRLDLSAEHALLGLRLVPDAGAGRAAVTFQRAAFFQALRGALDGAGLDVHAVDQEEGGLLLLGAKGPGEPLASRLDRLGGIFVTLFTDSPALAVAAGCSRPHPGASGLSACNLEAELALKAAQAAGGESRFLRFEELGVLRLIYSGEPEREVGLFVRETLRDLADPATPQREELLETLSCYFRCLGNQRRMAEELYIHYNTAAYRLKKVQALTGLDLDIPGERMQLELALYLHGLGLGLE